MRKGSIIHEVNKSYEHEDGARMWYLLHKALTETTVVQLIVLSLPSILVHVTSMIYQS